MHNDTQFMVIFVFPHNSHIHTTDHSVSQNFNGRTSPVLVEQNEQQYDRRDSACASIASIIYQR